jgi:phosphoribosylformimino-5-aminoimidazole carboxamide ribotide isomerase
MMTIYPAIDLKNGRVVRLLQGRADRETVYFENPVIPAKLWKEAGAEWLHIVDLDGAFTGHPRNWDVIEKVIDLGLKVQFGGGLRDIESVRNAIGRGVDRVVIGTKAVDGDDFIKQIVDEFGDKIAVGIDAKQGKVAVRGWVSTTDVTVLDLAKRACKLGVKHIIYTDISRDGMLSGPNFEGQRALAEAVDCNIIASGGVGTTEDVIRFGEISKTVPNLNGCIVGKALYEKRVDLNKAFKELNA